MDNNKNNKALGKVSTRFVSASALIGFLGLFAATTVSAATMGVTTTPIPPAVTVPEISSTVDSTISLDASIPVISPTTIYNDGTYTGNGIGFSPGTVVSVAILNDKITSVTLVSSQDTPEKYNTAYGPVIDSILAEQKSTVAIVSGATYSSEGMMSAVADALNQAKK